MTDLIDRQVAIDAIQGIDRLATLSDNDAVVRMSAVEHILFNLPSAQPYTEAEIQKMQELEQAELQAAYEQGKQDAQSERKQGKWIVYKAPDKYHCGMVKCPFCGEDMIAEADEYNFCPNCGADMRGGQDGQENNISG